MVTKGTKMARRWARARCARARQQRHDDGQVHGVRVRDNSDPRSLEPGGALSLPGDGVWEATQHLSALRQERRGRTHPDALKRMCLTTPLLVKPRTCMCEHLERRNSFNNKMARQATRRSHCPTPCAITKGNGRTVHAMVEERDVNPHKMWTATTLPHSLCNTKGNGRTVHTMVEERDTWS